LRRTAQEQAASSDPHYFAPEMMLLVLDALEAAERRAAEAERAAPHSISPRSAGLPGKHMSERETLAVMLCEGHYHTLRGALPEKIPCATCLTWATDLLERGVRVGDAVREEPLDLDAIQALADAATPGPWGWWRDPSLIEGGKLVDACTVCRGMTGPNREANAQFIEQSRTLIPALVAALRARVDAVRPLLSTEEEPTDADEPPAAWRHWFSCEECHGWFYTPSDSERNVYDSGTELCDACDEDYQARIAASGLVPQPIPPGTIDADAIIARGAVARGSVAPEREKA
jgi:hypothetical protein